jgi:hypothetical protein
VPEVIGAVRESGGVTRAPVPVGELNGTRAPLGTVARPVLVTFAGAATSGGIGIGAGAATAGLAAGVGTASVESGGGAIPGARVNLGGGGASVPTAARPTTGWAAPAPSGESVPSDPPGAVEAPAAPGVACVSVIN